MSLDAEMASDLAEIIGDLPAAVTIGDKTGEGGFSGWTVSKDLVDEGMRGRRVGQLVIQVSDFADEPEADDLVDIDGVTGRISTVETDESGDAWVLDVVEEMG